jgi:hypothetical protein
LVNTREHGQALVELSISIVFILIIVFMVIDLGIMYFTQITVRDAVQEAASYGSICPSNADKIRARFRTSATVPIIDLSAATIPDSDIDICVFESSDPNTCGKPATIGNNISVTATVIHKVMTPFLGTFIGAQQYPITVSATYEIRLTSCP